MLSLSNHLGDSRGAKEEMLSEFSCIMIIVNEAPVRPILNCTHVITHLESPSSPSLGMLSVV